MYLNRGEQSNTVLVLVETAGMNTKNPKKERKEKNYIFFSETGNVRKDRTLA